MKGQNTNGNRPLVGALTDVVDKDELQSLQDNFARANRTGSVIVDVKGYPITRPANHCKVCDQIRETSKGLQNCVHFCRTLGKTAFELRKPVVDKCLCVGFFSACSPIVVEGNCVASWLIGQNCVADADESRILSFAEEIGANKAEMLEAFREMETISETELEEKLEFLRAMANQLASIAYYKARSKQLADTLRKKKELEDCKLSLERIDEERAARLKALEGILPICMYCKKIRDGKGYWNEIEAYIHNHTDAKFSHGLCKDCAEKFYPDMDIYDDE